LHLDTTPVTIQSLTIDDGPFNTGLIIDGANSLTVTGNTSLSNTNNNTSKTLDVGNGTLSIGGNLVLDEGNANKVTQVTINTGTLTIGGDITVNSTGTLSNARVVFSGTGSLGITGAFPSGMTVTTVANSTIDFAGASQVIPNYSYKNLILEGSGTKTLPASALLIGGDLTMNGSASTTTAGNLTISGNLNLGDGSSLTTAPNNNLIVNGSTTIDGALTLAGSGAKTFNGDVSIGATGSYTDSGAGAVTIRGSLTNNGLFNSTNTSGTYTFSGTGGKTIGGTDPIAIAKVSFTQSYTNNGTLSVQSALSGGGTLIQGAGATLNLGGTVTITNLNASVAHNVVNYTGGNQIVKGVTYDYLVLGGSGQKTIGTAATAANSNLSIAVGVQANLTVDITGTINSLTLGGAGQSGTGSWGSSASSATNQNDTYFTSTTHILNVSNADSRLTPTITFDPAPTPNYLGGPFSVNATITAGDSSVLTYSVVSGPCIWLYGATFNSTGAGTCTVQAYGGPTSGWTAASNTQDVTIARADQATLTVTADHTNVVQGFTTKLGSTGGSGAGAVTYSVDGSTGCEINPAGSNTLLVTNSGLPCSVTATKTGDSNFNDATSAPLTINSSTYQVEINKSFSPANITPGQNTVLSMKIFNPNIIDLTSATFTDDLTAVQPGMYVNSGGLVSNDCGGTVTAVPGSHTILLAGGTIPAAANGTDGQCTIQVNVSSITQGNQINTIPAGALTADDGSGNHASNTTPASTTLQVSTMNPPSVNKGFGNPTMYAGDISLLTINLVNQDASHDLSGVGITDTLPANLTIATTVHSPALTGCGSDPLLTLTAVPGTSTLTLSGAAIPKGVGQECKIEVNVTGTIQGSYIDTIQAKAITSNQGVTNAQMAQATQNIQQMNLTKAFSPNSTVAGATSTAIITLYNPLASDITGVSFVDSLPSNLIYGSPVSPKPANDCQGSFSYNNSTHMLSYSSGLIPAGTPTHPGTCVIEFTVSTNANLGNITLTNTIPAGTLSDDQNITNPADAPANLTVTGAINGTKSFNPALITQGHPSTATVTLFNHSATAITGVSMKDVLIGGLVLYSAAPSSQTCGGTFATGGGSNDINDTTISMTGGTIPAAIGSTPGQCVVQFQVTSTSPVTGVVNTIPVGNSTTGVGVCGTEGSLGTVCNQSAFSSGGISILAGAVPLTGWKAFCPVSGPCTQNATNSIPLGGTSALTISLTAPDDTDLHNFSFTDNLASVQSGLQIANSPYILDPSCGPSAALSGLTAGSTSFTLQNGYLTTGSTCRVTVYVTAVSNGTLTNTLKTTDVSDTEGRTLDRDKSATLNISDFLMQKKFTPDTVNPNGISTLSITLTNQYASDLTNVNLVDTFPANIQVAPTPNASSSCGGTFNPAGGAGSISLQNGVLTKKVGAVDTICVLSVDVVGLGPAGQYKNIIPTYPTSIQTNANLQGTTVYPQNATTDTLTVLNLFIDVNKNWPDTQLTVFGGSASPLTISLTNPNNSPLTRIHFTDTMPAGMYLASPVHLVNTCGGTFTGNPGDSVFTYDGYDTVSQQPVSLAANASCTLTMDVSMNVNGNLTNTINIGDVTSINGASNPKATQASLTNLGGISIHKSFLPNPAVIGSTTVLTLQVLNTISNFPMTDLGLSDVLPPGLTVASTPQTTCSNGTTYPGTLTVTTNGTTGTPEIDLTTGFVPAASSCTVTISITSTTPGQYPNTILAGNIHTHEGYSNKEPTSDTVTFLGAPTLATTQSLGGDIGTILQDSASLTGGDSPTGPVTFRLYPPSDPTCLGSPVYTEAVAAAPYATTTGFSANDLGTYHWTAYYSGDGNNGPASSNCSAEPVTITKPTPSITTLASPDSTTVFQTITAGDSATLSGGINPTGSISFTLFSDATCSTPVPGMSGNVPLSGGTASWSNSWTPSLAGIYYWMASYSGDPLNDANTSACAAANEQITVSPLSGPNLFDPPIGIKTVDVSGLPNLTWTIVWINTANAQGFVSISHDPLPDYTHFIPASLHCTPSAGSTQTTTTQCSYDPVAKKIVWAGTLGPDLGVSDPALAKNAIFITYSVSVDPGISYVQNTATIDADRNANGETTDAGEQNVASASAEWGTPPSAKIPGTGFAPGRVTYLPTQPTDKTFDSLGDLWLEIPRLGVKTNILGIPRGSDGNWDISWLGADAGWLQGSAFPTGDGNAVLTGHVYDAFGRPGPFVHLNQLWWDDQVIVHLNGQAYVYRVRQVTQVGPNDTAAMLKHKAQPWLTLVTCRAYDPASDSYKYRILVQAVLVSIEPDGPPANIP
jgi:LPXTG-site transpeptidase (sortase) family protein